jgi:hypothetical protein
MVAQTKNVGQSLANRPAAKSKADRPSADIMMT